MIRCFGPDRGPIGGFLFRCFTAPSLENPVFAVAGANFFPASRPAGGFPA
jgi:hypothetical protein